MVNLLCLCNQEKMTENFNTYKAIAHPNIAFIKYWGVEDSRLNIPVNSSISMNLDGLQTTTEVTFEPAIHQDELFINDKRIYKGIQYERVVSFLDIIRTKAKITTKAIVKSSNNFPIGTGIASSASAFAALSLAGSKAANLDLSEKELTILARRGSGSASRSIPDGFVEWQAGFDNTSSFAYSIAPSTHWELVDLIIIIDVLHKEISSSEGHTIAHTSPLQTARIFDTNRRLELCREAILNMDFELLAEIVEQDSNMMHAVMMTSTPTIFYWLPATIQIIQFIINLRRKGIPTFYSIDAGANVHVFCEPDYANYLKEELSQISDVKKILLSKPGGKTCLQNPQI